MSKVARSALVGAAVLCALGCSRDRDRAGLEQARAFLTVRRDQRRALAAELDRDPGEMNRLIAEVQALRAQDPAFDADALAAILKRAAPAAEVGISGRNLWIRGS